MINTTHQSATPNCSHYIH